MPHQINLEQWENRYRNLCAAGLEEPPYGGPLSRHVCDGDTRLTKLVFDDSPAALRLWNFLLTENDRLAQARADGKKIIAAMKDLGTVPVMAYASPKMAAFYPDGAWWIPCIMELRDDLLHIADSLGIDESFCPVRAMLGAFLTQAHFPMPDLLTCSVGAVCDDFSVIAQRLNGLGYPILWWEIPPRRTPSKKEASVVLPGGFSAEPGQLQFVRSELERLRQSLSALAGEFLTDEMLTVGIHKANRIRSALSQLRRLVFTADICPLPALEMLIAEMLALHFCSDQDESLRVLNDLLAVVTRRIAQGEGHFSADAVRIFWVNPVADLHVMNLLETCNARLCGTEYLFCHALDPIPVDIPPLEALAQMALADPMVGPASDRAQRICRDMQTFGAEAVVISRIPGASHCATEGSIIADIIRKTLDKVVLEIEVPPLTDALQPMLQNRLAALVETVIERRKT